MFILERQSRLSYKNRFYVKSVNERYVFMGKAIKLQTLIDEMDFQMEGYFTYVNKQKGELVSVSEDILRLVEDGEIEMNDLPDWQEDMLHAAIDILNNFENYVEIPSQFDIHEYSIMEDFALNIKPSNVSDKLSRALQGRGAFRRFKDAIVELGVADEWYIFKEERLKEIAIKWCESPGIDYMDEKNGK